MSADTFRMMRNEAMNYARYHAAFAQRAQAAEKVRTARKFNRLLVAELRRANKLSAAYSGSEM